MQTTTCSHRPALGEVAPLSHHSNRDSHLELLTGNPGPTRMVVAIPKKVEQLLGQGSTSLGNSNLVEPNGAGITNTIGRAELPPSPITHDHIHIATDGHTSLHQIRKQLLYPKKHRHPVGHVQGDLLKILSYTIRNSQSHIFLYKVKSHAGIAGNECANALAKYQACHGNSLPAEIIIRTADPGGNPLFDISWLAVEEVNQQGSGTEAPQHGPRLTCLPNLQATLKSHMHSNHKLGYAFSTGTAHITRVHFHTSTKAFATLFGACPNFLFI